MEFDDNNVRQEQDDNYVEIYSKKAIFWFSVLTSPIFGGVLLLLNLKAAEIKQGFYIVLAFVILLTFAADASINAFMGTHKVNFNVPDKNMLIVCAMSLGANVIGGLVLTEYFFRKYFPEDDYYPKNIIKPVIITILLVVVLRVIGLGI